MALMLWVFVLGNVLMIVATIAITYAMGFSDEGEE